MLASNNRILNSSLAPQASQLYSSSNTSLTNIQQCPAHSRGTSLTTERRIVRFAADTMGGEENLTMASERLQNWRERTRRNPHLPSSLRQCSYSRKRRTTPQQPAFEYIIIVSGQGVQDKAKARHTINRKFRGMTKLQWHTQLSTGERFFIIQKFRIYGPFVKLHFATETEFRRAKNSANAHYFGGKPIKLDHYTLEKKIPEAQQLPTPLPSPENSNDEGLSQMFSNLDVQVGNNKFEPQLLPASDGTR